MTAADFRRLALSFPEAVEQSHMNHPDFRVGGRIFATLSVDEQYGVLLLSPEEQKHYLAAAPTGFSPVPGGWGRKGSTRVHLEEVTDAMLREAMTVAWKKRAPARLTKATTAKR